jgi:hypothetical protein
MFAIWSLIFFQWISFMKIKLVLLIILLAGASPSVIAMKSAGFLNIRQIFHKAGDSGDQAPEVLRLLLAHFNGNADIYDPKTDSTLLHIAVVNGNKEVCKLLLLYGAQMNSSNEYKLTPLMLAASSKYETNLATCKLLLEFNAPVNAQDTGGYSALMYAVDKYPNALAICKLLLNHGADLTLQEENYDKKDDGRTALICAAHQAHNEEIVRLFVDHQMQLEKSMYCLLWCLKKTEHTSGNDVYTSSRHLLAPYLKKFTLKAILNARYLGKTAYYFMRIDYLKPQSCPLCWQKKIENISPCCEQPICLPCWEKLLTQNDSCCPSCLRIRRK